MQIELCKEGGNTPKLQRPHGESTDDINCQPRSLPPPSAAGDSRGPASQEPEDILLGQPPGPRMSGQE